jgi:hypothetical protein
VLSVISLLRSQAKWLRFGLTTDDSVTRPGDTLACKARVLLGISDLANNRRPAANIDPNIAVMIWQTPLVAAAVRQKCGSVDMRKGKPENQSTK